ncbi:hypothetical protein AbraIFM66951_011992, partial [Aspergillus brasiliensis]
STDDDSDGSMNSFINDGEIDDDKDIEDSTSPNAENQEEESDLEGFVVPDNMDENQDQTTNLQDEYYGQIRLLNIH